MGARIVAPAWVQAELVRLMDVRPAGPGRYRAPAHGPSERNVVEAGQLLGGAVVAAAAELPGHRVTSVSMIFSRVAAHDAPLTFDLELPHRGRTFATARVGVTQDERLCASGLVLLDSGAPELISAAEPMPRVPPPEHLRPLDLPGAVVAGRDTRVVGGYDPASAACGPPELFVWTRFHDAPRRPELHAALLTQSTTHWTVAAALRPHAGLTEAMAHHSISTGITMATVTYHDEADVRDWLLYSTRAIYAGRGHAQGDGRVHAADGRLVASYTVHAMVRGFAADRGGSADAVL
ncbi:acyl-CoA thioesterase [Nocardia sp. NPDC004068]|uniref:acyl-CoA thioesterase n=1 Tax=Nocardia sp. NPDC004068 TaxID=3364303 RepID=UPI0036BC8DDF